MKTFGDVNSGDIVIYAPDKLVVEAKDLATGYVKEVSDNKYYQRHFVIEVPKYNQTFEITVHKDNRVCAILGNGWFYTTVEECIENELYLNDEM